MKTLNKKLTYLAETKAAIKTAIVEKGQTVEDTDTFRSYADKIRAIEAGGGGAVEGTATVTFCNYDGTELFSRPVFVGDNCPDPIAQGKINEPTRESTAQYTYAYSGWSLTAGGTASASALNVVTGDRTVYAAYTQNVRYYTVRFYDGTTLMKEEQIAYGVKATAPSTFKTGYEFLGWTPSDLTIYGDTDFYGEWAEADKFSTVSYERLAEICANGEAANRFSIGDTREIVFNGETRSMRIIGFNLDDRADGTGKASITVLVTPLSITSVFDSGRKTWGASAIRSVCRDTIFNGLEEELRNIITPVTKITDYYYQNSTTTASETQTETVFLPSAVEVVASYPPKQNETIVYPGLDTTNERILRNMEGTAVKWWTRTATAWDDAASVDNYGNCRGSSGFGSAKNSELYIAPCFCIG